jgi:hypothetical protein
MPRYQTRVPNTRVPCPPGIGAATLEVSAFVKLAYGLIWCAALVYLAIRISQGGSLAAAAEMASAGGVRHRRIGAGVWRARSGQFVAQVSGTGSWPVSASRTGQEACLTQSCRRDLAMGRLRASPRRGRATLAELLIASAVPMAIGIATS